ncbi:MAG: hypothetical protein IKQ89_10575 [Muribaculaceae bacterium]|nr:hypothetical protein [Muribaculaceae bacterium]
MSVNALYDFIFVFTSIIITKFSKSGLKVTTFYRIRHQHPIQFAQNLDDCSPNEAQPQAGVGALGGVKNGYLAKVGEKNALFLAVVAGND